MSDMGAAAGSDGDRTRRTVLAVYADFLEVLVDAFWSWLLTFLVGAPLVGVLAMVLGWSGGTVGALFALLQLVGLAVGVRVLTRRAKAVRATLAGTSAEPDALFS